jgi:hypothetical protein
MLGIRAPCEHVFVLGTIVGNGRKEQEKSTSNSKTP